MPKTKCLICGTELGQGTKRCVNCTFARTHDFKCLLCGAEGWTGPDTCIECQTTRQHHPERIRCPECGNRPGTGPEQCIECDLKRGCPGCGAWIYVGKKHVGDCELADRDALEKSLAMLEQSRHEHIPDSPEPTAEDYIRSGEATKDESDSPSKPNS